MFFCMIRDLPSPTGLSRAFFVRFSNGATLIEQFICVKVHKRNKTNLDTQKLQQLYEIRASMVFLSWVISTMKERAFLFLNIYTERDSYTNICLRLNNAENKMPIFISNINTNINIYTTNKRIPKIEVSFRARWYACILVDANKVFIFVSHSFRSVGRWMYTVIYVYIKHFC